MKKAFYIIGLLLSISACTKEDQVYSVSIDAELQPYIDGFIVEAEERGIEVDFTIEGLSAQLAPIDIAGVPGQCQQYGAQANELLIDPAFWKAYNEDERELLIFHELGHCYLDRDHKDSQDENGNCISIMRSSATACDIGNYALEREILLDELFE